MNNILKSLHRDAANNIARAEKELKLFSERLAKNPAYAFEWGDAALEAAANKAVWEEALMLLDNWDNNLDKLERRIDDDLYTGVINIESSTSKMSNQTKRAKTAAYGRVKRAIQDARSFYADEAA